MYQKLPKIIGTLGQKICSGNLSLTFSAPFKIKYEFLTPQIFLKIWLTPPKKLWFRPNLASPMPKSIWVPLPIKATLKIVNERKQILPAETKKLLKQEFWIWFRSMTPPVNCFRCPHLLQIHDRRNIECDKAYDL